MKKTTLLTLFNMQFFTYKNLIFSYLMNDLVVTNFSFLVV